MISMSKLAYLPTIGIGTGLWLRDWDPLSKEHALELAQYAVENGPAFFDTARSYGGGWSEDVLGEALAGVPRDRYFLASKAAFRDAAAGPEALRSSLLRSVETSLKQLRVDYLDILHLHDPDCCLVDAIEVAFPVLMELKRQGVARAIGSGMNQWQMLLEFARQVEGVDCFLLAGRYTLLEQGGLPLLDLCSQKGIAVFLGGVYNTGILATGAQPGAIHNYRPASPEILARVSRMQAVCGRYGFPLRAAAVQFALSHPAVRSLVLGVRTVAEYQQALEAVAIPIPAPFWDELREEIHQGNS